MKVKTPESMKFKRLQRRLGESKRGVAGLLELLWIAAQNNAKRGDIGKFSNEEIAIECDWEGDPNELVDALVLSGWLDECEVHRLVIHDWADHAPRYLHAWIKSQNTTFCVATTAGTTVGTVGTTTVATTDASSEGGIPSLVKPSQAKPSLAKPKKEDGAAIAAVPVELIEWCERWNGLKEVGLVPVMTRPDEPSKAVKAGWKRTQGDAELRKLVTQWDAIERELRASEFVRSASWLRPEKLLGGKNRDGEFIVKKLIEGGYRDSARGAGKVDSRNAEPVASTGSLYG